MQELLYLNADVAYHRFAQILRQKGYNIKIIMPRHSYRHRLIVTDKVDFYCLFRKQSPDLGTFEKFNSYFETFTNLFPEFKGHAETINQEVLTYVCERMVEKEKPLILAYIYADGKTYIANPMLFKNFAEKHNLLRQHNAIDIQKAEGGTKIQIHETTYHLPFKDCFFSNFEKFTH